MHGPTFMANPLACSAAVASTNILVNSNWKEKIKNIELQLEELKVCCSFNNVKDVRVLGAMGVVEMKQPVDMQTIVPQFVNAGVWVRPFGKLVYLMPPFIINNEDLSKLTSSVVHIVKQQL